MNESMNEQHAYQGWMKSYNISLLLLPTSQSHKMRGNAGLNAALKIWNIFGFIVRPSLEHTAKQNDEPINAPLE